MMCLFAFPCLMLIAGSYCAPATLFSAGGNIGYENQIKGMLGGQMAAERDFLSVKGTGKGMIGASWKPHVFADGSAQIGNNIIAGKTGLKADIANAIETGFTGNGGLNGKGQFVLGVQPDGDIYNRFILSPEVQLLTGDDARRLVGIPVENEQDSVARFRDQQVPRLRYVL